MYEEIRISEKEDDRISIRKGSKPIILLCIHPKEQGTVETNEALAAKEDFYSAIYRGPRDTCWENGPRHNTFSLIDEMISEYGRIGMISLHRRANYIEKIKDIRKKPLNRNLFEWGTLDGESLDYKIKKMFSKEMDNHGILFDDNIYFNGGAEIKHTHKKYNNPNFDRKKFDENHETSSNKVQIVQLELNGPKPWPEEYLTIVRSLADSMLEYFDC